MNALRRISERYLIPRWVASLYYYYKYRCLVSTKAQVQVSRSVSFGKGTVVKSFSVIQTQSGRISFGVDCAVGSFDHISTGTSDLMVGDYVRIGSGVTILGGSRNFKKKDTLIMDQGRTHSGLRIGDDVLIGAHAVILPGCHVGKGAVVGAGSIVSKPVPPYAIVAGAPARVIGMRE